MSTYIIAEAGVNHNGSLQAAKELVIAAAESGADAVKFQMFSAENLVTAAAPKAAYQVANTGKQDSQWAMLKELELSEAAHADLAVVAQQHGIEFLSTPFDSGSARFLLETLHMAKIKIGSGELTNAPFLLELGRYRRPMILSTGMSTLAEVQEALSVLAFALTLPTEPPSRAAFAANWQRPAAREHVRQYVSLLHCVTEYPAPIAEVNLRAMDTLRETFAVDVGFSDHTLGIHIAVAAVARGAQIIEKHFTLDRNLPGPDHKASLEPLELKNMVQAIREVELALGHGRKEPSAAELKNQAIARKSLVAARDIAPGEVITEDKLTTKRPGTGITPIHYWDYLGQAARQAYRRDELIS